MSTVGGANAASPFSPFDPDSPVGPVGPVEPSPVGPALPERHTAAKTEISTDRLYLSCVSTM